MKPDAADDARVPWPIQTQPDDDEHRRDDPRESRIDTSPVAS